MKVNEMRVNWIGIWTVYLKEMTRTSRVIGQTIISPVITTTLYFVVFGAAVGGMKLQVAVAVPRIKTLHGLTLRRHRLQLCSNAHQSAGD